MASQPRPTIAVDAMGGDHAPQQIVQGALEALQDQDIRVLLVGDPERIAADLPAEGVDADRLEVVPASQIVTMSEHPVRALKQKKDTSIAVAMDQVAQGKAHAVVSAGSTGAMLTAALFQLGTVPGVERPGIAVPYPSAAGTILIIDGGANVDCRPEYLSQFAVLGSVYAEQALQIPSPRVGLLNIGEERGKGDELSQLAYGLLKELPGINFVGNIEGRDIPAGKAHVVVCDGFVGNTILKLGEGLIEFFLKSLAEHALAQGWTEKIGPGVLQEIEQYFRKRCDYAELGGALLLGIKGTCIIGHGSSKARAIKNAIRVAADAVQSQVLESTMRIFSGPERLEVQ